MNGRGSLASFAVKAGEDYALKLDRVGDNSDKIAQKAVFAGAEVVADEMRRRLKDNLDDPAAVGKGGGAPIKNRGKDTSGDLYNSMGITPIGLDAEGIWNAKIGFDGYDSKGVPNQLKARAMESGTSTLQKRPFVRPAVNAVKKRAQDRMEQVVEEEIKKTMG